MTGDDCRPSLHRQSIPGRQDQLVDSCCKRPIHFPFSKLPSVVTWNFAGSRHRSEYLQNLIRSLCEKGLLIENDGDSELFRRAITSFAISLPGNDDQNIASVCRWMSEEFGCNINPNKLKCWLLDMRSKKLQPISKVNEIETLNEMQTFDCESTLVSKCSNESSSTDSGAAELAAREGTRVSDTPHLFSAADCSARELREQKLLDVSKTVDGSVHVKGPLLITEIGLKQLAQNAQAKPSEIPSRATEVTPPIFGLISDHPIVNRFRTSCWECVFGQYARAKNSHNFCRNVLRHTGPDSIDFHPAIAINVNDKKRPRTASTSLEKAAIHSTAGQQKNSKTFQSVRCMAVNGVSEHHSGSDTFVISSSTPGFLLGEKTSHNLNTTSNLNTIEEMNKVAVAVSKTTSGLSMTAKKMEHESTQSKLSPITINGSYSTGAAAQQPTQGLVMPSSSQSESVECIAKESPTSELEKETAADCSILQVRRTQNDNGQEAPKNSNHVICLLLEKCAFLGSYSNKQPIRCTAQSQR